MKSITFKIILQRKHDRYVIIVYEDKIWKGINFYHGIGAVGEDNEIDPNYLMVDEQLTQLYLNYRARYKDTKTESKILNRAIEAFLFANNIMH